MSDWPPKPMVSHSDQTIRYGPHRPPFVYLVVRHNGTPLGVYETRAEASAALARNVNTLHGSDDYEIRYVPRESVPFEDLRWSG